MPQKTHRFQSASTRQSLADGLAEYFAANPGLVRGAQLPEAAKAFFTSHDAVHVLFGCGTSLPDELVVKVASVFGTTAGFSALRGYRLHESFDIYARLWPGAIALTVLLAPSLVVRTIWRCTRQRNKWPWSKFEGYLNTPLTDLRARFGIIVTHRRNAYEDAA